MQFAEIEICMVTEGLWQGTLGLAVRRRTGVALPPERVVTASVEIDGDWKGQVVVECSERLALTAAARMLSKPVEAAATSDGLDAIGELANMTAGNLKAALPGSCRISLPRVRIGSPMKIPDVLSRISFEIDGELLFIAIAGGA